MSGRWVAKTASAITEKLMQTPAATQTAMLQKALAVSRMKMAMLPSALKLAMLQRMLKMAMLQSLRVNNE